MSILVVEYNKVAARILELNLHTNGYYPIIAQPVQDAHKYLDTHHDIKAILFDTLLVDILGFTFLETLEKKASPENIPLIMLNINDSTAKKAIERGYLYHLMKPVSTDSLMTELRRAISGSDIYPEIKGPEHLRSTGRREYLEERYGLGSASLRAVITAFRENLTSSIELFTGNAGGGGPRDMVEHLENLLESLSFMGITDLEMVIGQLIVAIKEKSMSAEEAALEYRFIRNELTELDACLGAFESGNRSGEDDPEAGR